MLLKRIKQRGNILAMAMAFMFVLVTVVIAMHTSQSRATRTVTQAEAELQFRQSAEFATANLLFGGGSVESSPARVKVGEELVGDHQIPDKYATKVWDGLPNQSPQPDEKYAPGHRTYKFVPKTNDAGLDVFASNFFWMTARNEGGYAAYAPNGNIKIKSGTGWANPSFLDTRPSAKAYSGVPLTLAGKGSIEVEKLPYGNAYSINGPIDLGSDKTNLALAFRGPLPLRPYQEALKQNLQTARSQMESSASSGDKTNDIKGGAFSGGGPVLQLLKSGDPSKLSPTLEQAMSFPFPMIPSFSLTVPGVFFEFWFHVPYPPDFSSGGSGSTGQSAAQGNKIATLDAEMKALEAKIDELKAKRASAGLAEQATLDAQIALLQGQLEDKADEQKAIGNQMKDSAESMTNTIQSKLTDPKAPVTREQDKSIPKTGQKGWNYSKLIGSMLSLLENTITGDIDGLAESFTSNVRLIHFGSMHNEPDFRFNDGFYAKASWTVPRGRSFKYNGKMTVAGDLWIQKGSVMHVTGDLTLENPDPSESSPMKPSGKLVLEEGATLIVGGNFRAAGDPRYGSLWVCSPLNQTSPVSSAIFVNGSCQLPYGSYSASNLEDAARAVGGQAAAGDALGKLFTTVAPNMAKVSGAFHERKPYFASYATTFQLTIIPPTIFNPPIPIPTPIPLPKENLLVPLFRAMTQVYAPAMNAALGENTYLHADWWTFGEGVVPAMIKINPAGPMNAIKGLNLNGLKPNIDWKGYIDDLVATVLKEAVTFAVKTVGQKIITSVIGSIAPGGSILGEVLNQVVGAIDTRESAFDTLRQKVTNAAVGPIVNQFNNFKKNVEDEIKGVLKESYLREVGGPLIYADSITVGDAGDPPLLMAGMLVAENGLTVNTESFVGSLTSFHGNISAGDVYFTPVFTRASLYKPKATSGNSLGRVVDSKYGRDFDSGEAVDVNTGVWQVTTEGWNR